MIFKILLIGFEQCGKTTLSKKYCTGLTHDNVVGTIGVEFQCKIIKIFNKYVKIHIWDCSGKERFNFLILKMIVNNDMPVFVCDLMNPESIEILLNYWTDNININTIDTPVVWVLCTKLDMYEKCATKEHIKKVDDLLDKLQKKAQYLKYIIKIEKVSGITGKNVNNSFQNMFEYIFCNIQNNILNENKKMLLPHNILDDRDSIILHKPSNKRSSLCCGL
jgi:small GTP-binding protein